MGETAAVPNRQAQQAELLPPPMVYGMRDTLEEAAVSPKLPAVQADPLAPPKVSGQLPDLSRSKRL
jgi:hypothetical protein